MKQFALAPYFHPTTVCVVDDNESFADSLSFELPRTWACRTFADPLAARDFLNEKPALAPLADRCFTFDTPAPSAATIHLDLSLIEQEINHVQRFRRVSVLVVDYAMPSLNGLELCAQLDDPYLKKVMLTGVADEKLAVEAFNAGLIHRFVPKQSAGAISTAIAYMRELQQEYFNQHSARLQNTLAISPPPFLVDPAIAGWIVSLMQRERFVEYYLVDEPPGLMLLRSDGSMQRLMIFTAEALTEQLQHATRYGAPADVRNAIEARHAVCLLDGDDPSGYFGSEQYPWRENLVPVEPVSGSIDWFVAVSKNPPADIDFDPALASYDAYLSSVGR
jgi:FixJ family two-component response regulator